MGKQQQNPPILTEKILSGLLLLGIITFFGFIVHNIWQGLFPFWYDPARDMLLGLDNLEKISLIGPPAGIPGIFYGPYWIWQISVAELISKDPRWVIFFVETLPYFLFFPLILFFFKDATNKLITLALFVLFIVSSTYYIQLWNPNISPLLYLLLIALLSRFPFFTKNKIDSKMIFLAGAVAGLIMNFHISFGLGIVTSVGLFLAVETIVVFTYYRKSVSGLIINRLAGIFLYGFSVLLVFGPFFLFETRHGFNQIRSLIYTLKKAAIENMAVVGQIGLSKNEIFQNFFYPGANLYHIPWQIVGILFGILLIVFLYDIFKKKNIFSYSDKKILAILFFNFFILLAIYLKSKNPVWGYHFVAVEIIYLVILGLIAKKNKWLQYGLSVVALIFLSAQLYGMASTLNTPSRDSNYKLKKYAMDIIDNDKKDKDFTLTIYDPAIYTFDYDYFLRLKKMTGKSVPDKNVTKGKIAYLIIPRTDSNTKEAFINYKTPNLSYKTVKEWTLEDDTTILRRELK